MPEPYWTAADQAWLDVLIAELVRVAFVHRERCGVCRDQGSAFCRPLRGAIEAVIEWGESRARFSKAIRLRATQDFTEWKAKAARSIAA